MLRFTTVGVEIKEDTGGGLVASGQSSVILGPIDLGKYPTKTFSLWNTGFLTLSGAIVQVNPDRTGDEQNGPAPAAALWHIYDSASFVSLASGECRSLVANDLFRWWRVLGANNQPAGIPVSGYYRAASL